MYREPDTNQNADPTEIEAALFGEAEPEVTSEPLRFSLWQLLTATTVAAALLALFRALGIWGAVFAFVVAAVCSLTAYRNDRQRQALLFDFIWGIGMPIVCLVFDPFVFKYEADFFPGGGPAIPPNFSGPLQLQPLAFVAYPLLAWQLAALTIVLVTGRLRGWWAAGFAGTLFVGLLVAGIISFPLTPLAVLGTLLLIGILGFTPLLTTFTYGRRVGLLWTAATGDLPRRMALAGAAIGAMLAAVVPGGLGLAILVAVRGWGAIGR
jgi:hypothetical protein